MSTGAEWCRFTLRDCPAGADPCRSMASSSVLFVGRSVGRSLFRLGDEENLDTVRLFAIVVGWTRDVDVEYCLPCPRLYLLPFGQLSGQPSPAENCWLSSGTRLRCRRAAERPRPSRCRVIQGTCRGPALASRLNGLLPRATNPNNCGPTGTSSIPSGTRGPRPPASRGRPAKHPPTDH